MAITRIGVGAQATSDVSNVTPGFPGAYSQLADDFAVIFVIGKSASSGTNPATPSGWTMRNQFEHFAGTRYLRIVAYYRFLTGSVAAPTFVIPSDWAHATAGGISAQMAVYRGVHLSNPFDVADALDDAAAAATWTPPSLTTVTAGAMVIDAVASNDDNTLSLTTANSFSAAMSGAGYSSTQGGDHSVGVADLVKAAAGAVTMPVWTQTVNGNDSWVGITLALRPASGGTTRRAQVSWAEFEVPDVPPPPPFSLATSLYAPRPAAQLDHTELWSDVEANGGILLGPIARWHELTEKVGLDGEHTLTMVLPFDHPLARLYNTPVDDENLRCNQVARRVLADGRFSEHRLDETTRLHRPGERTRTLVARSIFQDLGFRGMVTRKTADGMTSTSFEVLSLSMADHWQFFIYPALREAGAPFWDLGSVAHSFPVDMVYDGDTPLSALRKLVDAGSAALPSGALELGYEGSSTEYLLHIVEQIGAGLPALSVRARRNLIDLGFTERSADQVTRMYPRGAPGAEGKRPGPGGATWNVVDQVIGADYVDLFLADPRGGEGPIKYDGQFLPAIIPVDDPDTAEVEESAPYYLDYVTGFDFRAPIIETEAATQRVRVQTLDPVPDLFEVQVTETGGSVNLGYQRARIVADALGQQVAFVDHPTMVAKYGVRAGRLDREDIPGTENLVINPLMRLWPASSPLPTSWWAGYTFSGTATRETSPRYWEHGGQALRVLLPDGAEVVSPRILLPLRAQGFLSFFFRITTIQGRIRIRAILNRRLTDADGLPAASLPWKDGGTGFSYLLPESSGGLVGDVVIPDTTNIKLNSAEDLGVAAAWDLTKNPLYGGFVQLFVDRGRDETGPCECIIHGAQLTITPAQVPLMEGNGGTRLHKAANARLGLYATPSPSVAVNLVDLAMANGMRFPYDPELELGRPIEIADPDLNLVVSNRLVGWTINHKERATPGVEVSNARPDITRILASRTQAPRHEVLLQPLGTQGLTYAP